MRGCFFVYSFAIMIESEYNSVVSVDLIQFVRRRALGVFLAMALGIMLGVWLGARPPSPNAVLSFGIASGLMAISIPLRSHAKSLLIFFAIVALACGYSQLRLTQTPMDRLDKLVSHTVDHPTQSRVPIRVRGVLIDSINTQYSALQPGEPAMWKTTQTNTRLNIDSVFFTEQSGDGAWVDASGIVKLILPESFIDGSMFAGGDRVELVGLFLPTRDRRNFGDLDWPLLGAQSGRVGSIVLTSESLMIPIEHKAPLSAMMGTLSRWRSGLETRAMRAIGLGLRTESFDHRESYRPMLGAFLLGQRDRSFEEVYESFQRVGVAHVLAISGFHLAMVVFLGVFLIRFVGEYPRVETIAMVCILVAGMLVVPMRPPIVRAGVIVMALLISSHAGRRYDRLTTLAWVGCGLLIWRPMDVFSLGFQLSMGVTALLVVLSDNDQHATLSRATFTLAHEKRTRTPSGLAGRIMWSIVNVAKINIACWLVAMPVIIFHAGILSPYAPIVSLVLIPMVVITMVFGYMQIALGVVAPELSMHTIWMIDSLASVVGSFVGWVDGLPGSSVRLVRVGPMWTISASVVIAMLITKQIRIDRRFTQAICVGMLAWTAFVFIEPMAKHERAAFRIDMVDVGDGSCLMLQSGGEGLIWDCGSLNRRVGKTSSLVARHVGISTIRTAIVTHDNIDHFNGLIKLAPLVGLEHIWISRRLIEHPSQSWIETRAVLESMGITIGELARGQTIMLGETSLECLWPDPSLIAGMSENDTSVVIRATVLVEGNEKRVALFTGDIVRDAMDAIVRTYPGLKADVLELPHHGSVKAGAFEFVHSLEPVVVLQSTGPSRLGHARWDEIRGSTSWYASADRGGAWVEIDHAGQITHGWAWE
ncbi:hypothetical protein COB72_07295 [bacterium]|nr:MAG: hypothetical protein COB72_07295 [bacterium]